jgi:hypothetical protein
MTFRAASTTIGTVACVPLEPTAGAPGGRTVSPISGVTRCIGMPRASAPVTATMVDEPVPRSDVAVDTTAVSSLRNRTRTTTPTRRCAG